MNYAVEWKEINYENADGPYMSSLLQLSFYLFLNLY